MNERKLGILISYLNILLHTVIGFLYVPLLLCYIGTNGYGMYQLMGSVVAYLGIMDFGLTNAIVRFYARYKALQDRMGIENILAVSLRLYGGISLFVLLVGVICYHFLTAAFGSSMTAAELQSAKEIFLLLLLNLVLSLLGMIFRAVVNAEEKFLFLKGTELVQLVLQPVLIVAILQQYPSAFSVVLVQTGLNVLLILLRVYYCFARLHIRICFHGWDMALLHGFRKLALSIFAVSLIDQVFLRSNQLILGIVGGTAAVAVYSVAFLIYINYSPLSTAVSGVYLPYVSGLIAKRSSLAELSALFIRVGRYQYFLLLLVLSGFLIFGRQFIRLWAGPDFESAYWMALLIITPYTVNLIQNVGFSILQALNQYDFRAKVYLAIGVLNLALAIPLGSHYGGIGCAAATGFCMLVDSMIMNWYYSSVIGLAIKQFWQQIGKISLLGAACFAVGILMDEAWVSPKVSVFIAKMVLYTILYVALMWGIAMNEDEKNLLKRLVQRIIPGR